MNHLTVLPILIPLLAGASMLLLPGDRNFRRIVGLAATLALLPVALLLLRQTGGGEMAVYYLGDWPAPFGIVLVADRLSALMLTLTAALALAVLLYAVDGGDSRGRHFHVLFQMQILGVNGAFLTGDLFNLFVFFEILLIASYSLQVYGGGPGRVRAALHVVTLNLIGSAIFLLGIGAIYAATGTLNLADLAVRTANAAPAEAGLLRAGGLLLLVVFALKAAVVPLGFWLPPAYSAARGPVAALFAIMTKVGIYAIIRVHGLMFGGGEQSALLDISGWLLPLGLATVAVATLGVVASRDLRLLMAYLVVLSAGTLVTALGLGSTDALAAALFYILNSTLLSGGLFLLADLIARQRGSVGGALDRGQPVAQVVSLGALFFIGGIGIAGLPPFAGFGAKVDILLNALDHPAGAWVVATVLLSGLLVIVALSRAGSAIFWNTGDGVTMAKPAGPLPLSATALLILATAALMAAARPTAEFTHAAALQVADRDGYVAAVLSNTGVSTPASERTKP